MGQRNLAPGFTSAQNQTVEQQKKNISQETKPNQVANPMPSYFASFLCPSQCHLTILGSSCSALKPLFQSNGNYWGNGVSSQFLAVCPSPGKHVCTHTYICRKKV